MIQYLFHTFLGGLLAEMFIHMMVKVLFLGFFQNQQTMISSALVQNTLFVSVIILAVFDGINHIFIIFGFLISTFINICKSLADSRPEI